MNTTEYSEPRPTKVGNALVILYISLGIGIVRSIIEGPTTSEAAGVGITVFVALAVLAFMWWLIIMIGRRRNWARVTFLVLFLLGVLPSIWPLVRSFSISPVSGLLGLLQVVLQVIALIFLFQHEASAWFATPKSTMDNRKSV
jgi:hypothetical protein